MVLTAGSDRVTHYSRDIPAQTRTAVSSHRARVRIRTGRRQLPVMNDVFSTSLQLLSGSTSVLPREAALALKLSPLIFPTAKSCLQRLACLDDTIFKRARETSHVSIHPPFSAWVSTEDALVSLRGITKATGLPSSSYWALRQHSCLLTLPLLEASLLPAFFRFPKPLGQCGLYHPHCPPRLVGKSPLGFVSRPSPLLTPDDLITLPHVPSRCSSRAISLNS